MKFITGFRREESDSIQINRTQIDCIWFDRMQTDNIRLNRLQLAYIDNLSFRLNRNSVFKTVSKTVNSLIGNSECHGFRNASSPIGRGQVQMQNQSMF